jgi:hypothetical protein
VSYGGLEAVKRYVRNLEADDVVVSGFARGVDRTAEDTAEILNMRTISFRPVQQKDGTGWAIHRVMRDPAAYVTEAEWMTVLPERYPTFAAAAYVRNTYIIEFADRVGVFWDGHSRGTKDSLRKAESAGLPVDLHRVDNPRSV